MALRQKAKTSLASTLVVSIALFVTQAVGLGRLSPSTALVYLPTPAPQTWLQFDLEHSEPIAPPTFSPSLAIHSSQIVTNAIDVQIVEGYPTSNCSDELGTMVGYDTYLDPDGQRLHSLMWIGVERIVDYATISSATLWLLLSGSYDDPGASMAVTPCRIAAPWESRSVTWNNRPPCAESYPSTSIPHGAGTWYPFDVTELVRDWVDGTVPNYGLALVGPPSYDGWREFAAVGTFYAPYLAVTYDLPPGLEVTVVPDSLTVPSGQQVSSLVYLTSRGGFSATTTLSVTGLPLHTTFDLDANPLTPTDSSALLLTTTSETPSGVYTFTVTANATGLSRAAQGILRVVQPDFEIAAQPPTRSLWHGESATYTVRLTATNGFSDNVTLDLSGLPAGTSHTWSDNPVSPTDTALLTVTTTTSTPEGLFPLTITGTAGALVHTTEASLQVSEPDFDLALTPSWRSTRVNGTAQYTLELTAIGPIGSVALDIGGLPPDISPTWSANPLTPTASAVLTLTTTPSTAKDVYTFVVTATAANRLHAVEGTLYVSEPDFLLQAYPTALAVWTAGSAQYTAYLTAVSGFSSSVALAVDGLPAGVSGEWDVNPLIPTASTALTVIAAEDAPTGTFAVTITGASGAISHSDRVTLTVSTSPTRTIHLPLIVRNAASAAAAAVLDPAAATVTTNALSRIALIVGIADYEHMPPYPTTTRAGAPGYDVWYTGIDAVSVDGVLQTRGGFSEPGVLRGDAARVLLTGGTTRVLLDAQATQAAIHAAIVNWMDPLEDENTLVTIFFSGHGMYAPDDDGDEDDPYDEFIVPYEIDDDGVNWRYDMAIGDDELDSWLAVLESQRMVILLDSCFSGGMIDESVLANRGIAWTPISRTRLDAAQWLDDFTADIQGPGRVIVTASSEGQSSLETSELQDGVFSYYLLEAFRTPSADSSGNGWVSVEEAYAYLAPRVDAYVWNAIGAHQNPQISDGVAGQVDLVQLGATIATCPTWTRR